MEIFIFVWTVVTALVFYSYGRNAGMKAGVVAIIELWAEKYRMTLPQAAAELDYRLYEGTRAGAIKEIADLRAKK